MKPQPITQGAGSSGPVPFWCGVVAEVRGGMCCIKLVAERRGVCFCPHVSAKKPVAHVRCRSDLPVDGWLRSTRDRAMNQANFVARQTFRVSVR